MHVVVLGSGIVGTATAWYLNQAGHRVTVVDRQSESARETSEANGGQISVGHVEPWASWSTLPHLIPWLLREDAPLRFRLRADAEQWLWAMRFLRECTPRRTRDHWRSLLALGRYSRDALHALRRDTQIEYQALQRGILNLYDTPAAWRRGIAAALHVTALGYPRQAVSRQEAIGLEPALAGSRAPWVGATYTPGDESGDACQFTRNLSQLCHAHGVDFRYDHQALALQREGDAITGVWLQAWPAPGQAEPAFRLDADAIVVALGSYSAALLRPLGMRLPVYPIKGYSATVSLRDVAQVPSVSITDDAHKIVITRLGNELRIAGTAELTGYDLSLNRPRCEALIRRAREIFPEVSDYQSPRFWAGLRPATPSGLPLIGKTHHRNLYLNTGHGTLGWTLGCGSGKALAELISGRMPEVDFSFSGT